MHRLLRPFVLALLVAVVTISCNQTPLSKVNKADLNSYVTAKIKVIDAAAVLESLEPVSIDTMTQQDQYNRLFNMLTSKHAEQTAVVEQLLERSKLNIRLLSLSDEYRDEVNNDTKKIDVAFGNKKLMLKDMRAVNELIIKADSIKPVAYVAYCAYRVKLSDNSTTKDTTEVILDTDYSIMSKEDFARRLQKIYKPKSNFVPE